MKKPILTLLFITIAFGTTIHVPGDASTIQEGLNTAVEGDTVLVASGTYVENIIWPPTNGIKLIGSGQDSCIIDGDSSGSVIRFEEELNGLIDTTTHIIGFTITNGYLYNPNYYGGGIHIRDASPTLSYLTFSNNGTEDGLSWGGGVHCKNSNSVFNYIILLDNHSAKGGGIHIVDSSPVFNNIELLNNSSLLDGGGIMIENCQNVIINHLVADGNYEAAHGGGIFCTNSNISLNNVDLINNAAYMQGGGFFCEYSEINLSNFTIANNNALYYPGGGLYIDGSRFVLFNGTIRNNQSGHSGGGIWFSGWNNPNYYLNISQTSVYGNTAELHGGGIYFSGANGTFRGLIIRNNIAENRGGGLYTNYSNPMVSNSAIINNISNGNGGGLYSFGDSDPYLFKVLLKGNSANGDGGGAIYCQDSAKVVLNHVTVTENFSYEGGAIFCGDSSFPIIENSILWNNVPNEIGGPEAGDVLPIYSNFTELWEGEGNISSDPLFCNPDSGDFTLNENSPCVGSGQNGTNMGAFDVGCGTVGIDNDLISTKFALHQNYPNPFNPSTTIRFAIPALADVNVSIYDIQGRLVDRLIESELLTGEQMVHWNAANQSSGIYFVELMAGENRQIRKMILLK